MVKGNFPKKRKSVIYNEKKNFSQKIFFGHILGYLTLYLSAKNQKKLMKEFCTKSKKPYFQAVFAKICPKKSFFENRAPSLFGHCHFAPLCQKSAKNNEPIPRKAGNWKMVNGNFPKKRKSVIYDEKKFSGKNCFGHFLEHIALSLSAKNQKKQMKQFCTESKKPYFYTVFGPNLPPKFFF